MTFRDVTRWMSLRKSRASTKTNKLPDMSRMRITADDVAPTPWRNGEAGRARDASPGRMSDWKVRVSITLDIDTRRAVLIAFPGVDRWFGVLSGAGVILRGRARNPARASCSSPAKTRRIACSSTVRRRTSTRCTAATRACSACSRPARDPARGAVAGAVHAGGRDDHPRSSFRCRWRARSRGAVAGLAKLRLRRWRSTRPRLVADLGEVMTIRSPRRPRRRRQVRRGACCTPMRR